MKVQYKLCIIQIMIHINMYRICVDIIIYKYNMKIYL